MWLGMTTLTFADCSDAPSSFAVPVAWSCPVSPLAVSLSSVTVPSGASFTFAVMSWSSPPPATASTVPRLSARVPVACAAFFVGSS